MPLKEKFVIKKLGNTNIIPNWYVENKLWSLHGQFIDYLIRFYISRKTKNKFEDFRSDEIISNMEIQYETDLTFYNNITKYQAKKLINSYNRLFESKLTEKFINDLFNTSICHSIWFDNFHKCFGKKCKNNNCKFNDYNFIGNKNHKIYRPMLDSITNYFNETKIINKNIKLNPVLSLSHIKLVGDADIIINDNLIDIKVSKDIGEQFEDFYQLIIYACMYFYNNREKINKLIIYNPLCNKEYSISLENWNEEKNMIKLFETYFE